MSRKSMFQLTRPRGTRRIPAERRNNTFEFQLTRPRGTRREERGSLTYEIVSTHASARDATSEALCEEYGKEKVCLYHGGLNAKQRDAELDRFEAKGGARFLVATQSCGGHGLNLQFGRWQIFFANGFKYSERLQAEDRCHRHGQRRHVTYIDLCASDTIDEKIDDALAKKGSLLDAFRREVKRIKDDKDTDKADKVTKLKEMVRTL